MLNLEYLKNLNEKQKEAVLSLDGPLLIVAGAGSGKTKVLISRIAHIIKNTNWQIVTVDRLDISGNLNRLNEILEQFTANEKKRLKIVFHDQIQSENKAENF